MHARRNVTQASRLPPCSRAHLICRAQTDVRLVHHPELAYAVLVCSKPTLLMGLQTVEEVKRGAEAIAENYKHSLLESREQYDAMYKQSIEDPDGFWSDIAKGFYWEKQVSLQITGCVHGPASNSQISIYIMTVLQWEEKHISYNFDVRKGKIFTEFFKGGQTNVCYNCLDKHIKEGRGDQTCFIWEGNDVGRDRKMTYHETLDEVCRVVRFLAMFAHCSSMHVTCNICLVRSKHMAASNIPSADGIAQLGLVSPNTGSITVAVGCATLPLPLGSCQPK